MMMAQDHLLQTQLQNDKAVERGHKTLGHLLRVDQRCR